MRLFFLEKVAQEPTAQNILYATFSIGGSPHTAVKHQHVTPQHLKMLYYRPDWLTDQLRLFEMAGELKASSQTNLATGQTVIILNSSPCSTRGGVVEEENHHHRCISAALLQLL